MTVEELDFHLVSYYTQTDLTSEIFPKLSIRADIMALDIPPEILKFTEFRVTPKIVRDKDEASHPV